jgi:hypothetical protein
VTYDYLHSIGSQACLTTISNCADYQNCTGKTLPTAAQCPDAAVPAFCSGTGANASAINCGADINQSAAVQNCSALGANGCKVHADSTCGVIADCTVSLSSASECSATSASNNDGNYHCDTSTNIQYTCIDGIAFGESCTSLHATCIEDPVNGTGCYYNGTSCSTPGYTCNAAGVLKWCTSNDDLFNFNCATAGLTCAPDEDGGNGYCLAPGCTIDDSNNCTDTCAPDGKTMSLCVGGAPLLVDCTKYGFKACFNDTGNNDVYCTN